MTKSKWPIGYQPPYPMGGTDGDPEPRREEEGEKQVIRLCSPDGSEDIIEIDKKLWDEFAALAKERGVTEEKLLLAALDNFLKSEGY